jgi:hypothetical protein
VKVGKRASSATLRAAGGGFNWRLGLAHIRAGGRAGRLARWPERWGDPDIGFDGDRRRRLDAAPGEDQQAALGGLQLGLETGRLGVGLGQVAGHAVAFGGGDQAAFAAGVGQVVELALQLGT